MKKLSPLLFHPSIIEKIVHAQGKKDEKNIQLMNYAAQYFSTQELRWMHLSLDEIPESNLNYTINTTLSLDDDYKEQVFFGLLPVFIDSNQSKKFVSTINRIIESTNNDLVTSLIRILTDTIYVLYIKPFMTISLDYLLSFIISAQQFFVQIVQLIIIIDDHSKVVFTEILPEDFFCKILIRNIQVIVSSSAQLEWNGHQQLSSDTVIAENISFILFNNSTLNVNYMHTGAFSVNSCLNIFLEEQNARAHVSMPFIAKKNQQKVLSTNQYHRYANTISSVECNGIVADVARTHYYGNIVIDKIAHDVSAKQINKQILLSKDAQAFCLPALQVSNNQVHCSHGTATGQLDMQQLNYLCLRGLPYSKAIKLLLQAFFKQNIENFIDDSFFNQP